MTHKDPYGMAPPRPMPPGPPVYSVDPYHAPYPYYGEGHPLGGESLFTIDPLRLLHILRKRWLSFGVVVLVFLLGAFLYMALATRIFEAISSIEMSSRRPRLMAQQAAVIEDPVSAQQFETTINTQLEKFRGGAILPYVMEIYRQANPEDARDDEELVRWLRRNVTFSLIRRTRLVQIAFRDPDPALAQLVANSFAQGAEAHARSENRAASDNAVAWLEAQAKVQQEAVGQADRALSEARQTYQMDALQGRRQTVQRAMMSFNEALVDVERDLAKERELLEILDTVDLDPENAGNLPTAIPRAAEVATALERWLAAVTERERLMTRFTLEHPEVRARDADANLLRSQAMAALERARNTSSANLRLLQQQADSLRRNRDEQGELSASLEQEILDREMRISAFERARDAANLSYQGVLNRIQEARLSADENTTTVQVAQSAQRPTSPVRPRRVIVLLLGLFAGGILGVVYVSVTEVLEDHVSGVDDVEYGAGMKIVAVVPHVETASRKEMALSCLHKTSSVVTEAFAGLRSILNSGAYSGKSQVILVASSIPAEGKTTTACNLAGVCALSGQRTLLIDFDLRRPRIAGIFPMPSGQRGLLEYLSDASSTEERLDYDSKFTDLRIIASRPVKNAHPAELMGNPKMVKLIEWAREHFDRVIIDAPPLGIVSDALVLAGLSDCVLIMARPGASRKRALRHTVKRFHEYGVTTMAAVVNDVDLTRAMYGSYTPYHQYHAHSASYLNADHDEPRPSRRASKSAKHNS